MCMQIMLFRQKTTNRLLKRMKEFKKTTTSCSNCPDQLQLYIECFKINVLKFKIFLINYFLIIFINNFVINNFFIFINNFLNK